MTDTKANDTVLPLLAAPESYHACPWNLTTDHDKCAYWLALFRRHFPSLLDEAVREAKQTGESEASAQKRAQQAKVTFETYLDEAATNPEAAAAQDADGRLDILTVCHARERALREAHFSDPYRLAKARENETALRLLPRVLAELDATPMEELPSGCHQRHLRGQHLRPRRHANG